ncbi:conserved oligomeric Golgi complex subunit 2 isoform X1 [Amborella trichopoda]|uniref:conserved oligomeric Golgi complex subunit 2 isoform X1 n=1 Tax=Amborella trichopoda TaxID=13333 RepID=UPI0005D339F5|nr:conserved oligomeric Golgi complex subunit 2 isoform X1 [Amborella trichopoda]|eukprot:XP_011624936.1 conserved oligomeric Golgi complex subunit 2 isoform X1 [Amborella trichopoda]
MADLILQSPVNPRSTSDLFGDPHDSQPLWFKKEVFSQQDFDPDAYVADLRRFVPLESLRAELRAHLSTLKSELVELINRDYADFVSLSTKLVDVDGAVLRMRAPLNELRARISQFRASVEASFTSLRDGLQKRADAAASREVLERLLDTSHVVSKVEKLILELPSTPADWSNPDIAPTNKSLFSNDASLQPVEHGANLRETQSMLLERIASEMNRLKFYMAHAENLPFIANMEKRIQSAASLLDSSLGHCFVAGLEHRDTSAIYNCLRAYAAIENTASAEEIFRSTIVAPLIEKVIPHNPSREVAESSADELGDDYQQIKRLIEKDCKFLLEIAASANSGLHVFDFLANSILKEVQSAIQKGKPEALSAGKPTEFLRNYKASLDFLAHLEGYCPSRSAVSEFRSRAVYIEFIRQWNIGVYFSLRFQEIASALDLALMVTTITVVGNSHLNKGNSRELTLNQSVQLLECLRSCWKEDVFVHSLSDKFLRLSLELLSRYATWLSVGLAARKGNAATQSGSASTHAGNTSSHPGGEWALAASPEDFIYVMHDVDILVTVVNGDYMENVLQLLSSCSADVLSQVRQSISSAGKRLVDLVPSIMDTMIEGLVEKSVEDLRQIKGIPTTYRMTNKPPPVRHSPYVSGVLRPLKAFLEGERAAYLASETKSKLIHGAAERITGHYYEIAWDVVNVQRRTESSLQRLRQGAQRRGGASSDASDHNISDTDKICMQLFLDIQEYGRNLSTIGVQAADIPAYHSLWQCLAPTDMQTNIRF